MTDYELEPEPKRARWGVTQNRVKKWILTNPTYQEAGYSERTMVHFPATHVFLDAALDDWILGAILSRLPTIFSLEGSC